MRSLQHIQQMKATATMKPRDLNKLGAEFNSIYVNNQSFQSALLAAGGCFNAVEKILTGQVTHSPAQPHFPTWAIIVGAAVAKTTTWLMLAAIKECFLFLTPLQLIVCFLAASVN